MLNKFNTSLVCVIACLSVNQSAIAQTAPAGAPVVAPATNASLAQAPVEKLIYRAPGSALTVKDFADLQRKKLQADFYKSAGFTETAPVVVSAAKSAKPVAAPTPMSSLSVLGVYGPVASQKADLVFDGVLRTAVAGVQMGRIHIESISPGKIVITYSKKTTTVRQTLKAGDTLEVPA